MKFKEYEMPDGRKAVFEYDENGVGKITLECMDMLMGQLIAYKRCIQSRSFWDGKHCDGCIFYDDCPFNPREDEDEPQTDCAKMTEEEFDSMLARVLAGNNEPQTERSE